MCSTSDNESTVSAWHQLLVEAFFWRDQGTTKCLTKSDQFWWNFLLQNTAAARFISLQHKIFGHLLLYTFAFWNILLFYLKCSLDLEITKKKKKKCFPGTLMFFTNRPPQPPFFFCYLFFQTLTQHPCCLLLPLKLFLPTGSLVLSCWTGKNNCSEVLLTPARSEMPLPS